MGRLPQKAVVMSARLHSWPQAIAGSTGDGRWRVSKAGGVEGSNGRLTDRRLDTSRVSVNSSRSSAREESWRRRTRASSHRFRNRVIRLYLKPLRITPCSGAQLIRSAVHAESLASSFQAVREQHPAALPNRVTSGNVGFVTLLYELLVSRACRQSLA